MSTSSLENNAFSARHEVIDNYILLWETGLFVHRTCLSNFRCRSFNLTRPKLYDCQEISDRLSKKLLLGK